MNQPNHSATGALGARFVFTLVFAGTLLMPGTLPAAQVIETDVCIYGGTSGGVIAARRRGELYGLYGRDLAGRRDRHDTRPFAHV